MGAVVDEVFGERGERERVSEREAGQPQLLRAAVAPRGDARDGHGKERERAWLALGLGLGLELGSGLGSGLGLGLGFGLAKSVSAPSSSSRSASHRCRPMLNDCARLETSSRSSACATMRGAWPKLRAYSRPAWLGVG